MNKRDVVRKNIFKNNRGITLILLLFIIVLVLTIAFSGIYWFFYGANNTNIKEEIKSSVISNNKEDYESKMETLGIDERIVNDITQDNVPIPTGFSLVDGNKESGIK